MKRKIKLIKVGKNSLYDWTFKFDRHINAKAFIKQSAPRFNSYEIIKVEQPEKTECFLIIK